MAEFANAAVVTQLMMHTLSFLSVISLKMTEIYCLTLTLKLSKSNSTFNPYLLTGFSDFFLCKFTANCMKQIDDSYLLKVDLTEAWEPAQCDSYLSAKGSEKFQGMKNCPLGF